MNDHQVVVEWAKMTKHVSCWRIPKDQVISLLVIDNLNSRRNLICRKLYILKTDIDETNIFT